MDGNYILLLWLIQVEYQQTYSQLHSSVDPDASIFIQSAAPQTDRVDAIKVKFILQ